MAWWWRGCRRLEPWCCLMQAAEVPDWAQAPEDRAGLALRARIMLACADRGPDIAISAWLGATRAR